MERTATIGDIAVYDDFAHHPTAIRRSLVSLKKRYPGRRILVALEPRSNTMKLGVHNDTLADSLACADLAFIFNPAELGPGLQQSLLKLDGSRICPDYDSLIAGIVDNTRAGDVLVFMSNGGFGGVRHKATAALQHARDTAGVTPGAAEVTTYT